MDTNTFREFARSGSDSTPPQTIGDLPQAERILDPVIVEEYAGGQLEIANAIDDSLYRGDIKAISLKLHDGLEALVVEFWWLAKNLMRLKYRNVWVKAEGSMVYAFDLATPSLRHDLRVHRLLGGKTLQCIMISRTSVGIIVTLFPPDYEGKLKRSDVRGLEEKEPRIAIAN